jgi:hypothetical protein
MQVYDPFENITTKPVYVFQKDLSLQQHPINHEEKWRLQRYVQLKGAARRRRCSAQPASSTSKRRVRISVARFVSALGIRKPAWPDCAAKAELADQSWPHAVAALHIPYYWVHWIAQGLVNHFNQRAHCNELG